MYKSNKRLSSGCCRCSCTDKQYIASLFSQIDVCLNDLNVSSATTTYPYRAHIETHLNYGTDAKKSRLQAAMYVIDDNLTVSNPIPDSSSARNTGLKRRHGIYTAKPTFNMIGPLHVDVFNQSKYMLNGVTMKVRMTRSKPRLFSWPRVTSHSPSK